MEVEKNFRTAGAVALVLYAVVLLINTILMVVMAAFGTILRGMLIGTIVSLGLIVPISIFILMLGLRFKAGGPKGTLMFVLLLLYCILAMALGILFMILGALGIVLGLEACLAIGILLLTGGIFAIIAMLIYRAFKIEAMVKGGIFGVVAASLLVGGILLLPAEYGGLSLMPSGVLGGTAILIGAVGVLLYPLFLEKKSPFMTYMGLSGAALLYGIASIASGATSIALTLNWGYGGVDTASLIVRGVLNIVVGISILVATGFGIAVSALADGAPPPPKSRSSSERAR